MKFYSNTYAVKFGNCTGKVLGKSMDTQLMQMNLENNCRAIQLNDSHTITTVGQHIVTIATAIAINIQMSNEDLCARTLYSVHNRICTALHHHCLLSLDFHLHACTEHPQERKRHTSMIMRIERFEYSHSAREGDSAAESSEIDNIAWFIVLQIHFMFSFKDFDLWWTFHTAAC